MGEIGRRHLYVGDYHSKSIPRCKHIFRVDILPGHTHKHIFRVDRLPGHTQTTTVQTKVNQTKQHRLVQHKNMDVRPRVHEGLI
jgi:hypothetical protein